MSELVSKHYDEKYFERQRTMGEFGGWANQTKFIDYISNDSNVLDFGCGGGYLLNNLKCSKKVGVEINPAAIEMAKKNGVEVFTTAEDVPDEYVDVVISNNVLEHTLQPLTELKSLYKKLKPGGKIIFVVPCDSIRYAYKPKDVNNHLYSWSPMNIGNLFIEAGFSVLESKPYIHKWPPKRKWIVKVGGRFLFDIACSIYGRINRKWFQVKVVAEKKA